MIRVLVFGGFGLEIAGVSRGAELARRLAAVLAILAAHGRRGISRDRLLHLLWSESDPTRARHALTQTLYSLRRILGGDETLVGTAQLALNPELVDSDAFAYEKAEETRDVAGAIAAYRGAFLEGFTVNGAPEFERWVEERRLAYQREFGALLERSADERQGEGAFDEAAQLLRRRAGLDPLDANSALLLMRALARAGDVTGATQHARIYGELVRQQLELEPDLRVVELERELEQSLQATPVVPSVAQEAAHHLPAPVAVPAERALTFVAGVVSQVGESVRHARSWWRSRSLAWRANVLRGALAVAVLALATLATIRVVRAFRGSEPQGGLVVLPFRSSAVTPDLAFLSTGIAELLTIALAERDTITVIGAEKMEAWWQATFPGRTSVMSDSAVRLARTLGVRQIVTGSVVGNGERIVVRASLVNAGDLKTVAAVSADAPFDSLSPLVDRLATLLVADAAGALEEVSQMPNLSTQALRAYLSGRAAYARGDLREAQAQFTRAISHDSTFGAAAVGIAMAADWLDDVRSRTRALDMARRRGPQLSNYSQQQLTALLGPRFPAPLTGTEYLAGWERLTTSGPPRPESWVELGRRLLADGRLAGVTNSLDRARAAFLRALALDSTSAPARRALVALALLQGRADDLVRASSSDDTTDALLPLSWRLAAQRGNATQLASARQRLPEASDDALRRIALAALYDGVLLDDGQRALDVRQSRGGGPNTRVDAVLASHAFALTGGRPAEALAATRRLEREAWSDGAHLRLQVLDGIYAEGDTVAALDAVERLSQRTSGGLSAAPDERSVRLADLCVLEQWRVWRDDFSSVESTIRVLSRADATSYTAPVMSASGGCAVLLEAIASGLRDSPRAEDALDRAERLAFADPTAGDLRHYATLALARVRERRGEIDRASELVRRRSTARAWPRYLASYLRMEARLSAQMLDTTATRAALQHYLALRSRPEPVMSIEVDSLRLWLRRLDGS